MRLLTIYPIQSCNLKCEQCPATEGQIPVNHPWNKLNNEMLFPWMTTYFPPHKTFVELRGGEPSLYPEINELMFWLNEKGYYGLVKTNGILPIPKTPNFIRIAAWHRDIDQPPEHYDSMLILANPKQDWQAKVRYCEENNIPYKTGEYVIFHGSDKGKIYGKQPTKPVSFFKSWTLVYSNADINQCPIRRKYCVDGDLDLHPDDRGAKVWKMSPPRFRGKPCPMCPNVTGQELWITPELRAFLQKRERDTNMAKYRKTVQT